MSEQEFNAQDYLVDDLESTPDPFDVEGEHTLEIVHVALSGTTEPTKQGIMEKFINVTLAVTTAEPGARSVRHSIWMPNPKLDASQNTRRKQDMKMFYKNFDLDFSAAPNAEDSWIGQTAEAELVIKERNGYVGSEIKRFI
jgi:hypothetical protein